MGLIPTLIVIFTCIANALICIVVWKNNSKSWTNRLLVLLSASMALWTITNFLAISPGDEQTRLFWVRVVMAATAPLGVSTYLLAVAFPNEKIKMSKVLLSFVVGTTIIGIFAAPYMFVDIKNTADGGFSLTPGLPVLLFAFNHFVYTTAGLLVLVKKYKKSTGRLKYQLYFVLLGLILTLIFITLTNFIAVVVFRTIQYTFIGPVTTLFQVGFVTYAIIKHKFLDIRSIIARAVSFTALLALIVILEVSIFWVGTQLLPLNIDRTIIALAGSIIIILSYSSIRSVITDLTERVFFHGRYDEEDLLKALTSIMASEMNVKFLELKLTKLLCQEMKLSSASFLLVTDFVAKKTPILNDSASPSFKYASLEKMLHTVKKTMIFEDLTDEVDKEIFRKLEISLILPLIVGDEDIGLLILGPKLSGDIYVGRDIELLEIFAPQAAIALKNADSYRQIQEFSQTLELKVIDRTHELEESQKEQLKLKDEFVFIATHDLATPVTAISGFIAMINASQEKMSDELHSNLEAISEASSRLKVLVNDLLQVARSDSGTIKVDLTQVDASELLKAAVKQATPLALEKHVTITSSVQTAVLIQADPKKLSEVFENLISNAVKYNKPNGSLKISNTALPGKSVFEFKDTGLGIDENEQAKVFSKFFRSETAEVRQRPGTGLGLFVVRMLVEKMGGKISFESIKDIGTTFTLEFNT